MSEKSRMIKKEYTLFTEIRNEEKWIKIILQKSRNIWNG